MAVTAQQVKALREKTQAGMMAVSYTHLRAHET